jgi:hypothetical protein
MGRKRELERELECMRASHRAAAGQFCLGGHATAENAVFPIDSPGSSAPSILPRVTETRSTWRVTYPASDGCAAIFSSMLPLPSGIDGVQSRFR